MIEKRLFVYFILLVKGFLSIFFGIILCFEKVYCRMFMNFDLSLDFVMYCCVNLNKLFDIL